MRRTTKTITRGLQPETPRQAHKDFIATLARNEGNHIGESRATHAQVTLRASLSSEKEHAFGSGAPSRPPDDSLSWNREKVVRSRVPKLWRPSRALSSCWLSSLAILAGWLGLTRLQKWSSTLGRRASPESSTSIRGVIRETKSRRRKKRFIGPPCPFALALFPNPLPCRLFPAVYRFSNHAPPFPPHASALQSRPCELARPSLRPIFRSVSAFVPSFFVFFYSLPLSSSFVSRSSFHPLPPSQPMSCKFLLPGDRRVPSDTIEGVQD